MSPKDELAARPEHPDYPGWYDASLSDPRGYNRDVIGQLLVRVEPQDVVRVRMLPRPLHENQYGMVHGAVVLGLVDVAAFVAAAALRGKAFTGAVTLEVNNHFVGAGTLDKPLDAVTEIVRETGKLIFARGTIEQGDKVISSWSSILRKITPK